MAASIAWPVLSVLALLFVAAACSGDDDGEIRGTSSTTADRATRSSTTETDGTGTTEAPSTSETTTGQEAGSVEDEIVRRYLGFWEARFEANSPPVPDAPGLAEYATGGMLDQARAEVAENDRNGVEFRRVDDPVDFRRVDVVEVAGDSATVQDCVVNDGLVVRSRDGAVVNGDVATHNLQGEMRRVDGEWRLAESRLLQSWQGVAGCARAD